MAKDRMFFLISVVFLGIMAAFLFRPSDIPRAEISHPEKEEVSESEPTHTSAPPPEVKREDHLVEVMVAGKDLKIGDPIKKRSFVWEKIKNEDFNPTLVSRNPQTEKWLNEAVVSKPVNKGQKVKRFDILWPDEIDENELIPKILPLAPGKRAVPFGLTDRSGIAQFMKAGMFVDITFNSKPDIGFGSVSLTLLKNIRILAVGRAADGNKGTENYKPSSLVEILLEMTPKQAEIFFYAQQTGKVSIGLVESEPSKQKDDVLLEKLLRSESAGNFQSVLVTYMIRDLFPGVDVTITATPKGFIVAGKVPDPQVAGKIMEILIKLAPGGDKNIVDLMEVNPQQVLVCVKVCEVVRNFRYRLGINWEALWNQSGQSIAFGAVFPPPVSLDANYFFEMNNVNIGNLSLSALVNMLQENKLGTILADPNLTTVSGQTAHFFAGGEFPILIPQGGALLGTVTVEYKKFGVILDLTPTVDINGLITIRIRPEVSTIDRANSVILQGFVIPSLKSRFADTMVKLWPGQSYLIAGLLNDEMNDRTDSLYCLDKLPIIGPLFRSKTVEEERTELMIVVTPYLVNSDRTKMNVPFYINQEQEVDCCSEEGTENQNEDVGYENWKETEDYSPVPALEYRPPVEKEVNQTHRHEYQPYYSQPEEHYYHPNTNSYNQWEENYRRSEERGTSEINDDENEEDDEAPDQEQPEKKEQILNTEHRIQRAYNQPKKKPEMLNSEQPVEQVTTQPNVIDPAVLLEEYQVGNSKVVPSIKWGESIPPNKQDLWSPTLKDKISNQEDDSLQNLRKSKKNPKQK